MVVIYGVIAVLSLLLAAGYNFLVQKKQRLLILLCISIFVVNLGYFLLSISKTLGSALNANRIAYLGSVFLPFFMFLTILDVCKFKYNQIFLGILIVISVVVFLLAASGGYSTLYYKHVSLEFIDGAARLIKDYGPLHCLYYVYLFVYFGAMVMVILFSAMKKNGTPYKLAIFLAAIVLGNVGIWFVEQKIDVEFEFLSVSYVITELLLMLLYGMLEDGLFSERENTQIVTETNSVLTETEEKREEIEEKHKEIKDNTAENLRVLPKEVEALLTIREKEVLLLILENKKRKDIAEELCVSENTIKKHTSHIFSKMEVTNRKELFEKMNIM